MTLTADSPVAAVRGAGVRVAAKAGAETRAQALARLGVATVADLLAWYPRRYIDRSKVQRISTVELGRPATIIGTVRKVVKRQARNRRAIVHVTVEDGSGALDLTFFNQPWVANVYREGHEVAVSGVAQLYKGRLQLANQEVELLRSDEQDLVHTGRIVPVHRATEGLTSRTIRQLVHDALDAMGTLRDDLPPAIVAAEGLVSSDAAVRGIHFPDSPETLAAARDRLKFEELFVLELGVAFRKHRIAATEPGIAHPTDTPLVRAFASTMPFEPTGAQGRAMAAIDAAMARPEPMNLLLQGDVGSGKTLVALHAAIVAIGAGHQAAMMAPTEVLAGQHARSVEAILGPMGAVPFLSAPRGDDAQASLLGSQATPTLTYALLTAAVTGKDRERILEGIASGAVDLVLGTHALVQEGVRFADLSLAVIDEQHRFGVHQRMALKGKGSSPDVLIMTATPIPRTIALTYYGDLDVVVLDELPKGRQPIETMVARTDLERARAEDLVRREVAAGRQAFVVCAAIDEGNRSEVRAAEAEAERLRTEVFPELSVAVLHGRMRPAEKAAVMERFRAGDDDLLISTTVIEVGVDVPNATVMLVENAERFGLAQLHQLRGRIGRGAHRSSCVLFDESKEDNEEARARLAALARTTDGFALADEDLRLRGEGTLFDVRQSGMPDLKLARLAYDLDLVGRARQRAFALVADDPDLTRHPELLAAMRLRFRDSIDWLFHG